MRSLRRLLVLAVIATLATEHGRNRVRLAVDAYRKAVASGAKPIEAVGTAVAAFVGLVEGGGTSHTHPS